MLYLDMGGFYEEFVRVKIRFYGYQILVIQVLGVFEHTLRVCKDTHLIKNCCDNNVSIYFHFQE